MQSTLKLTEADSGEYWELQPGQKLIAGRSRDADIILVDENCSRRQFQLQVFGDYLILTALSDSVATLCNGSTTTSAVRLVAGAEICAGETRLTVELIAERTNAKAVAAAEPQMPPSGLRSLATQAIQIDVSDDEFGSDSSSSPGVVNDQSRQAVARAVTVSGEAVIGREDDCEVQLDHIQVSRRHALIDRRGEITILRDLQSANGTYVDGRRIGMPIRLNPGARIGIGPYLLSWTGEALVPTTRTDNLQLEGRKLTRRVPSLDGDGMKTILDAVSMVVRPHEFVCLLGPTGSGKSTLLAALSARTPANSGQVLINQSDLYDEFESLKRDIAVVPQHDILHDELTLDEALGYTARLRLPEDTSPQEIDAEIFRLVEQVGLSHVRDTKLGRLSGGQRRRASLANELLGSPSLLFLDEVTSGLDELTDRQMMMLFRNIADSGKTVVCVTHTLANIEDCCHLIVLLTVGGKLAFLGTPQEACEYFKISRLGLVYEILADAGRADEFQKKFAASKYCKQHVDSRLSPGAIPEDRDNDLHEQRFLKTQLATMKHQLPLLLERYAKVFKADRRSLFGLGLQVLIVAAVLYLVFGDVAPITQATVTELSHAARVCCNVLFVLAVSCFWFGCNNSAREVVKERPIYTRELLVNLSPGSFYVSKFALQFVVAAVQSVLLLAIVDYLCNLPGNLFLQGVVLSMAAGAGVVVGLCLSSLATTQEVALTLVPLVLIPQIILSDVFVKLEGVSRWLGGGFVANYWVYGLLRGTLPDNLTDQLNAPLVAPLRMFPGAVSLLFQTLALSLLSVCVLHIRDRVMSCSNKSLKQAISELPLVGRYIGMGFYKLQTLLGRDQPSK